jgi:succinate dehydrogenase flavin-adding protein (antitoxin of CptAB toxin-antitoxin module)
MNLDNIIKTIRYRGLYRGTREADFLIKEFIEFSLKTLNEKNLASKELLEELLCFISRDDQEIFDSIIEEKGGERSFIIEMFKDFYLNKCKK